jgi:hypothetical protein
MNLPHIEVICPAKPAQTLQEIPEWTLARVRFRNEGIAGEYFVRFRVGTTAYSLKANLSPVRETQAVEYQVEQIIGTITCTKNDS